MEANFDVERGIVNFSICLIQTQEDDTGVKYLFSRSLDKDKISEVSIDFFFFFFERETS